jgi:hypothetical protein
MVTPIWGTTKKQGHVTIVISKNAQETMGVKWWSEGMLMKNDWRWMVIFIIVQVHKFFLHLWSNMKIIK